MIALLSHEETPDLREGIGGFKSGATLWVTRTGRTILPFLPIHTSPLSLRQRRYPILAVLWECKAEKRVDMPGVKRLSHHKCMPTDPRFKIRGEAQRDRVSVESEASSMSSKYASRCRGALDLLLTRIF